MHPLAAALRSLGGLARSRDLARLGFSESALAHAVRAGRILRVRKGVYAAHDADHECIRAAAHGGALGCASALRKRGVWVLDEDPGTHVWVGQRGRVFAHPVCDCVTHFSSGGTSFGLVDVETALVQLFGCAGEEAFFAAYESAWHLGLLSSASRARIRIRLPATARWLLDLARADADSGLESIVRLRLIRIGIVPEFQVSIDGVGRVDFVIDDCVIVEADGKANHEGPGRHRDRLRDAAASRRGYETLHFDYAQIIHDWPSVEASILAARARGRARR